MAAVQTPASRAAPTAPGGPAVAPARPDVDRAHDFDADFLTQRFPPHKVVVHDNDYTPFDWVTKIFLKAVPGMTAERAYALTMEVHTSGSAVPFVGPKEQAEHVAEIIRTIGIKVTVEPDC
jgi:ATP-dependent Clp protease adapter protein ClpS